MVGVETVVYFFRQKTTYEMRIGDCSTDVCSADLSDHAREVADQNIELSDLDGSINTHCSDLFDQLPQCEYGLIVCNPPYVNNHSIENLPQEYRHEPTLALAGGEDGMDLIRRLLQQAPDFLAQIGRASCRERVCQYV